MKVLHAAETIKGGVATVINSLVEHQTNIEDKLEVHCLIPSDQKTNLNTLDNLSVHSFKRKGRSLLGMISFAWVFFKLLIKEKPDVVHLHSTFAGVIGRLIILITFSFNKIKVFYCPHAFSFLMSTSMLKRKIYVAVEKVLAKIVDKIICVSKTEYIKALEYGFNEDKLVLVYNGVKSQPIINARCLNYKDEYNILYIGRFDYQKGVDILKDAIVLLQKNASKIRYNFTIIGEAVNDNSSFELENSSNVKIKILGWLKSNELIHQYLSHDLIVIPSRWEGFAMVPLEAMSFGLPLLTSDIDPFKEVVVDGDNGLIFNSLSSFELFKKLCLIDTYNLEMMRERSVRCIIEQFSEQQMCSMTYHLYRL